MSYVAELPWIFAKVDGVCRHKVQDFPHPCCLFRFAHGTRVALFSRPSLLPLVFLPSPQTGAYLHNIYTEALLFALARIAIAVQIQHEARARS
jgi:hypothetical protein